MDTDVARQRLTEILASDANVRKSAAKTFKQFVSGGDATATWRERQLQFEEIRVLIESLTRSLNIRNASDDTLSLLVERYGNPDHSLDLDQFTTMYRDLLSNIQLQWFGQKPLVPREVFVPQRCLGSGNIHDFLAFGKDLGSGTFGHAYVVVEKKTSMTMACKVIRKEQAKQSIQSIIDEIEILKLLDHPNIIKIYGVYEDQLNIYLCMEYCEGGELHAHFAKICRENSRLTERYLAVIMSQILSAVAYAHEKRIAHKDLKLNNILFWDSRQRDIKVIDYNVAEFFDRLDGCSEKFAGTPNFMAPEVLQCQFGLKCDVWSCGVILYALLAAKYPFGAKTVPEVVERILNAEPAWERDCEFVSPEAISLMQLMLRKRPEDRPTAAECLRHPWITGARDDKTAYRALQISTEASSNLRSFMRHSNLKKILVNLMAHKLDVRGSQIRRIIDDFKKLDTDGNGMLSYEELESGLGRSGWRDADIARVREALDLDHSRTIDYTEFLAACYSWRARECNAVWWAFNSLDTDGDGKITVDEFASLFRRSDAPGATSSASSTLKLMDEEDLHNLMARIDKNGNGSIEWDEFYHFVREGY